MRGYAELSREAGEISATEAALILGAHPRTLRRWGRRRIDGQSSPVRYVREDKFGRYWFAETEIRAFERPDPLIR
jgi:hypothetical protein